MPSKLRSPSLALPSQPQGNAAWMLTLADLMSLMLTFFVLLFSMSNVKVPAWEAVSESFIDYLNPDHTVVEEFDVTDLALREDEGKPALALSYVFGVLDEKLERHPSINMQWERGDNQVVMSLSSDILFAAGSAHWAKKSTSETVMRIVNRALSALPNAVEIVGHTDPVPINSKDYPSNWHLSLARAQAVRNALIDAGYRAPLQVSGRAAGAMDDISQDLPTAQRYKQARRVDIIIREFRAR